MVAQLRGLSFSDNLLLSVHQERLNQFVNDSIDGILTKQNNFISKFRYEQIYNNQSIIDMASNKSSNL